MLITPPPFWALLALYHDVSEMLQLFYFVLVRLNSACVFKNLWIPLPYAFRHPWNNKSFENWPSYPNFRPPTEYLKKLFKKMARAIRPLSFESMVPILIDWGDGGTGNYKCKCQKFINANTGRKNQILFRTCSFSFIFNCHTQSRVTHSLFP